MTTQEEKDLLMVQENGRALQYVKEQTEDLCMVAVKQDGLALEFVDDQTVEICLAALQQDGWALQYVKKQTPEICLAALQQDGCALRYVKKQTTEICLAAVKKVGWTLQYVKKQTPEICLAAVKQDGCALRHVKKQTPKICLTAVRRNGMALQYVKNQTFAIVMSAMRNDDVSHYIDTDTLYSEYLNLTYVEYEKSQLHDILNLEYHDEHSMSDVRHYLLPFIKKNDEDIELSVHACTGVLNEQMIINLLIEDNKLYQSDYTKILKEALIWKRIWKHMLEALDINSFNKDLINIFILSSNHKSVKRLYSSINENNYTDLDSSDTYLERMEPTDLLLFRNELFY